MYHLVSEYGNVHKETKDARKREELLRQGYTEVAGAGPRPAEGPKRSKKGESDYPSVTADTVTPPLTRGGKKKEVEA